MKNSKGLKGVTDAMSHCKSMYAKGGSAGQNQIIRMGSSYELGGFQSNPVSMPEEMCGPGDPCHKSNKKANRQRLKAAGVSRRVRRGMN